MNRADETLADLKVPPHSIEAEQSVLGGLMLDNQTWDDIADRVNEKDFFRHDHRLIFRAIESLALIDKPFDVITLSDWLTQNNQIENVGGLAYLGTLANDTPSAANIKAYADIVREHAILRNLISVSGEISSTAFNPSGLSSKEILDKAEQRVFEIAEQNNRQNNSYRPITAVLKSTIGQIEELSKLEEPITGMPTGFIDLDKQTSGLQEGDLVILAGRPSMGKCIVSGSRVLNPATGALDCIDDIIAKREGTVATLNADFRLAQTQASEFVDDGIKPVYRVRTALGREITTTASHPFLTIDGWKKLAELEVGARIAVPRRLDFFGQSNLSVERVKLIAESLSEKHIPTEIFTLPREKMALFINRAFACDGSVYIQNKDQVALSYCSVSHSMAGDMQHLLLRFGILANLRERLVKYKNTRRKVFELRITHQQHVRFFLQEIGIFSKEEAAENALTASLKKRSKVNLDTLPIETWQIIQKRKGDLSWAELARRMGRKPGHNFHVGKRGIGRSLLAEIATALQDEHLQHLAESDLYWDRIESITYQGEKQVYDLSIPETHNFIAEDILVHNTTLAINIAEHAVMRKKKPVLVFSMEMPAEQIATRILSSLGRTELQNLRTGKLSEQDWINVISNVNLLAKVPLFIDDTPGMSPTEVRARARRLKREQGDLGLIVLDYIQLMQLGEKAENRVNEISAISRSLKALARELKVPVIALSQLNRSLESRPNKRPIMSDLRESGAIEQDADLIIFIYRDEVYNKDSQDNKGAAEIIISKQRNGPIGTVNLTFHGNISRFDNYTDDIYEQGLD